ncbi:MAG: hypothetical protein U0S12_09070 [Fimbriimonadales bacterium]
MITVQDFDIARLGRADLAPIFRAAARDEEGRPLDCLKVEQAAPRRYLGVHHFLVNGKFDLCLAESSDLVTWRHVRVLDHDAHQGTLAKVGDRWLLAWEKTETDGNHLRLRAFDSLEALLGGKAAATVDLPRTLAPTAEGTPNIESVRFNGGWNRSVVELGFHFYRNQDVDRQAVGSLRAFKDWVAHPVDAVNQALEKTNRGNFGDRDSAVVQGHRVSLLEVQGAKNDWSSWCVFACAERKPFSLLSIRTPLGSTAFANPTLTALTLPDGKPGVVVTVFVPSQGAAKGESGEMIWAFPLR